MAAATKTVIHRWSKTRISRSRYALERPMKNDSDAAKIPSIHDDCLLSSSSRELISLDASTGTSDRATAISAAEETNAKATQTIAPRRSDGERQTYDRDQSRWYA